MGVVSEHRALIDGLDTFWRRAEPGSGAEAALFLHGVPTNADIWQPFLERCGGIALDLPGFGRSGKPSGFDYSVSGYADFLEAFVEHLGLERLSLVGQGWGGAWGLALAQRLHARLERLILFNAIPLLPGYGWHRAARIWRLPLLGEMAMGFTTRFVLARALNGASAGPEPLPGDFIDSAHRHFDHGTQRAILKLHRAAPPATLARCGQDLDRIEVPSLILSSGEDPYVPAEFGAAYAEALGGEPRLELLERAGHWAWLDRPELIETTAEFLA
ncbi:MAG: alpha/beta fold hydrolase [Thermoleophilaceae bacterium]